MPLPRSVTSSAKKFEQLIIWVAMDTKHNKLKENCSTSVPHYPNLELEEPCPPWFKRENIKRIRTELGAEYAHINSTMRALHQGVVTVEILRHQYPYRIVYLDSAEAARSYLSGMSHTEKNMAFVWLDAHQDIHPHGWMHAYDTLTNECGSIFPPREEIVFADFKIYDMQTFDRIAKQDGTYRPRTCYPGAQTQCLFSRDEKTVMKRSHSCCATHVKIIPANQRGRSPCEKPPMQNEDDTVIDGYYRWMHQAYVPSLVEWGEFRVFIATKAKENGGREPYILRAIRTCWIAPKSKEGNSSHEMLGDNYLAFEVTSNNHWPEYPGLTYKGLTRYALHIYQRLQELDKVGFQSLNVGGRLDIGISPDGTELFVNELTRWYGAHQFAMSTQHEDYDKVCRAYAKAFAEVQGFEPRDRDIGISGTTAPPYSEVVINEKEVVHITNATVPKTRLKRIAVHEIDTDGRREKGPKRRKVLREY